MPITCPACGAENGDGANFCQNCGTALAPVEERPEAITASYMVDSESGDLVPVDLEDVVSGEGGAALVVRGGGGHVGESFPLDAERMAIGRRPDSDVFLDDVTVSRDHAMVVRRGDAHHLDDLGSLNGTYVNRRRIDSQQLADGDELQIGKYKLVYVAR